MTLNQRCKNFLIKASQEAFMNEYLVGLEEDFTSDEYKNCEYKVDLLNGKVYLVECPPIPHDTAAMMMCTEIVAAMEKSSNAVRRFHSYGGPPFGHYRNLFQNCKKRERVKIPDGAVVLNQNTGITRNYGSPVVVEVAFRNEDFELLIREGINRLSRWTDVIYTFLLRHMY